MGISGEQYDRFARDYTPNKDRRMKEWKTKKEAQKKERLERAARAIASRESEREERLELKSPVVKTDAPQTPTEPISTLKVEPGATYKKPRRSRRKNFHNANQPTLFDGIE